MASILWKFWYIALVYQGGRYSILGLTQVKLTQVDHHQWLIAIWLRSSGIYDNSPQYRVAILHTIKPKCHGQLQDFSILSWNLEATVYRHFIHPQHRVLCILPLESCNFLALAHSALDQPGLHSVLNRPVRWPSPAVRPRFLQDGRTAPRPSVSVLPQDGRNVGRHPPSSGGHCISLD